MLPTCSRHDLTLRCYTWNCKCVRRESDDRIRSKHGRAHLARRHETVETPRARVETPRTLNRLGIYSNVHRTRLTPFTQSAVVSDLSAPESISVQESSSIKHKDQHIALCIRIHSLSTSSSFSKLDGTFRLGNRTLSLHEDIMWRNCQGYSVTELLRRHREL